MDRDTLRHVLDAFDHWIRAGYGLADLPDEVEQRIEDLADEPPSADELRRVREHVERGLAARRAEEATWSEETVNDRLDEAFAELLDAGIVALQDAGFTLSDGWEDVAEARREVPDARGAVFWHGQDTERAVRGEGLSLAFGAFPSGERQEADAAAIGHEVCDVLRKHGIEVSWSGSPKERIRVAPFQWRKREAVG